MYYDIGMDGRQTEDTDMIHILHIEITCRARSFILLLLVVCHMEYLFKPYIHICYVIKYGCRSLQLSPLWLYTIEILKLIIYLHLLLKFDLFWTI